MSTVIRSATLSDRDAAIRGLNASFAPRAFEKWNRLFELPWVSDRENYGYAAFLDDEMVGFVATLYSTRVIRGKTENFCNLSAWWVSPSYRGKGLAARIAKHVINDIGDSHHMTALTAVVVIRSYLESQGFRLFDDRKRMFYPRVSSLVGRRALGARENPDRADVSLPPAVLQILDDHRKIGTRVVVFDCGGRDLLMVVRRRWVRVDRSARLSSFGSWLADVAKSAPASVSGTLARIGSFAQGEVPTCEVLYVNDPHLYAPYHDEIVAYLCRTTPAAALLADERQLSRSASGGPYYPAPYYFRSKSLGPEDMDALYSEIVLLFPS